MNTSEAPTMMGGTRALRADFGAEDFGLVMMDDCSKQTVLRTE